MNASKPIQRILILLASSGCLAAQPARLRAQAASQSMQPALPDGQRDFDWEFGAWSVEISRLQRPLTGSTIWVKYQGLSVVRKVWDGRANLGEINVRGSAGQIQGLSMRTYNPDTRQWHISWANVNDGILGPPMIGGFKDGRGEFYNQETLNGRAIYVRFIFSKITATTFELEQAFSGDGGKSWEPNWIAKFVRVPD